MSRLRPIESVGMASVRWDEARAACGLDVIALSVADMDFAAPEEVTQAVMERAAKGNFCYTYLTASYFTTVSKWFESRYDWLVGPEEILGTGRVVEALPALIQEFTSDGAEIVVPFPAYGPIPSAVGEAGRVVRRWDLCEASGTYEFDFETARGVFEGAEALILTNPHNPTGRVWTESELASIARLAEECGLLVISDEVHSDLVLPGNKFTPFVKCAGPNLPAIAMLSPGKTFNIAGLETTNLVATNKQVRSRASTAIRRAGAHNPRFFAQAAVEAAYSFGEPWLEELIQVVAQNADFVEKELSALPGVRTTKPEGTYLLWLDCRKLGTSEQGLVSRLSEQGLVLTPGSAFGAEGFLRMNLAVPHSTLRLAVERLRTAFSQARVNVAR